jgi:NAD-dependent SIR2 family protein deacetylase
LKQNKPRLTYRAYGEKGSAMKKRLIDANELKKRMLALAVAWRTNVLLVDAVIDRIDTESTVDAVEVVHGYWEHLGGDEWCCTACGEVIHTEGSWEKPDKKYCYECGAKMNLKG